MTQLLNNMSQTWNSPGVTKTGIKLNITDTASASDSLLMDLQVGGSSRFKVDKSGYISESYGISINGSFGAGSTITRPPDISGIQIGDLFAFSVGGGYAGQLRIRSTSGSFSINQDTNIFRDNAGVLAQRNGVNAQTFRLYNTYTDASNYERLSIGWSGNSCTIAPENAGTGSARYCRYHTSAATYFGATGNHGIISVGAASYGLAVYCNGGHLNINTFSGGGLAFSSGGGGSYNTPDVLLHRDTAAILAQRNGVNAQTFRIYKTYTDASNYERLSFFYDVGGFYVATERAGTGVGRNLCLRAASDYIYSENVHVFNKWLAHTSTPSPGASVGDTIRFHANTAASKIRWSMIDPDGVSHVIASQGGSQALIIPVSDESTALTTGTGKMTFRMPYAFKLLGVRASVNTAPVGATLNIDINENGVSVLSTVLSIDSGEKTSTTAATPAVISDADIADDAEITIDIDQVGSSVAGAGLKITLIGSRQ